MAVAQNLKATHTVDERVRGVANMAVANIDNKVKDIDARVASVDDGVVVVDDKVAEVIHDGKEAKQVMKQTANDVDLVKRSSSLNISLLRPMASCR
jgi:hypothetical protein